MSLVKILWVNARRRNARLHAILNSNKHADLILVQEPWFDKIGTVRLDFDPEGTDTFGTVANPLWDILYPKYNPGERCKVVAYRCILSTSFTITNQLDLASNYHTLTLDIHTNMETFCIYNTSLWPCLWHGSLACSLPLPSAQASSLLGALPPNPLFAHEFIYRLRYNIYLQSKIS